MTVLEEAREYLEKMKEHTTCCGVPIVTKMVAEIVRLEDEVSVYQANCQHNCMD